MVGEKEGKDCAGPITRASDADICKAEPDRQQAKPNSQKNGSLVDSCNARETLITGLQLSNPVRLSDGQRTQWAKLTRSMPH